jgi:hypothetical protein
MRPDVNVRIDHAGEDGEAREIVRGGLRRAVTDLDDARTIDRNDCVAEHAAFAVEDGSGPNRDGLLRARRGGHAKETRQPGECCGYWRRHDRWDAHRTSSLDHCDEL